MVRLSSVCGFSIEKKVQPSFQGGPFVERKGYRIHVMLVKIYNTFNMASQKCVLSILAGWLTIGHENVKYSLSVNLNM